MARRPSISKGIVASGGSTRIDAFKASSKLYLKEGFRSKVEQKGADQLTEAGVEWVYEKEKLKYTIPMRVANYLPDFRIGVMPRVIYLEFKGWPFEAEDRQKMILARDQNPDKDIRIVFQNAQQKIYPKSKTTVGEWASEHNFKWADRGIVPTDWINEVR